jgi:hypothetical protein
VLDARSFAARNADMEARYKAGTVGVQEFADFYVGTLAGRSAGPVGAAAPGVPGQEIVPRIPPAAMALVRSTWTRATWWC